MHCCVTTIGLLDKKYDLFRHRDTTVQSLIDGSLDFSRVYLFLWRTDIVKLKKGVKLDFKASKFDRFFFKFIYVFIISNFRVYVVHPPT